VTRQESLSKYKFNHISTFNGLPFFSSRGREWIEQKTGEKIDFDKYFVLGPPWQVIPPSNLTSQTSPLPCTVDLPEKAVIQSWVRQYQSAKLPIIPFFFNSTLFEGTIAAAYDHQLSPASPDPATAKACIVAFMTLMQIICEDLPSVVSVSTESSAVYQQQAMALLPEILFAPATVDGLQTVLMLVGGELIHSNSV
jgi:hypothetical protein